MALNFSCVKPAWRSEDAGSSFLFSLFHFAWAETVNQYSKLVGNNKLVKCTPNLWGIMVA